MSGIGADLLEDCSFHTSIYLFISKIIDKVCIEYDIHTTIEEC